MGQPLSTLCLLVNTIRVLVIGRCETLAFLRFRRRYCGMYSLTLFILANALLYLGKGAKTMFEVIGAQIADLNDTDLRTARSRA